MKERPTDWQSDSRTATHKFWAACTKDVRTRRFTEPTFQILSTILEHKICGKNSTFGTNLPFTDLSPTSISLGISSGPPPATFKSEVWLLNFLQWELLQTWTEIWFLAPCRLGSQNQFARKRIAIATQLPVLGYWPNTRQPKPRAHQWRPDHSAQPRDMCQQPRASVDICL